MLSGFVWEDITPSTGPQPRTGFGLARNAGDNSLLLIGGMNGTEVLHDIWRASGDDWTTWQLVVDTAPFSPRHRFGCVSPSNGIIVVFGGLGVGEGTLADVWRSRDAGLTWSRLGDAPWVSQHADVSVVLHLADGRPRILLLGGHSASSSDSVVWKSDDEGLSWTQLSSDPEYGQQRLSPILAVRPPLAAGEPEHVFLAGGVTVRTNGTHQHTRDVWRSTDGGVTWDVVGVGAPFGAQDGDTAVLIVSGYASLVLLGGTTTTPADPSTVSQSTHAVSHDGGASWSTPLWSGSSLPAFASAKGVTNADGSVLLVTSRATGIPPSSTINAFTLRTSNTWSSADCASKRPALCRAPPVSEAVAVRVASGSGHPATANMLWPGVGIHVPPVPTLELAAHPDSPSLLRLRANMSAPVSGLTAQHFGVVDASNATSDTTVAVVSFTHHTLDGRGGAAVAWELDLEPVLDHVDVCPPGFSASARDVGAAIAEVGASVFCVKILPQPATWRSQRAACAPYDLATIRSTAEAALLGQLVSPFETYW